MTKEELEAQKKAEEDKAKAEKDAADKKSAEDTAKLADIMKDPEAIRELLATKRAANAEAKEARLKLEKLEKDRKDAEDKALQEQGKFKELAEKHKAEAEDLKKRFMAQRLDFELKLEAMKAGIRDAGDAVRLCDRAGLKLSEDFSAVEGAKEAVDALKKAKPYLFAETDPKIAPPDIKKASLKQGSIQSDDSVHGIDRIMQGLKNKKK